MARSGSAGVAAHLLGPLAVIPAPGQHDDVGVALRGARQLRRYAEPEIVGAERRRCDDGLAPVLGAVGIPRAGSPVGGHRIRSAQL